MASQEIKRVKGILRKPGFFVGVKRNHVYEFALLEMEDNLIELSIWDDDGNGRQTMVVPSNYIQDIVQILDGPGASVLFNKNK